MFPRGLKSNIAIYIAVLLLVSMLLIDFVMIMISRRDLIHSQISKAHLFIASIEGYFSHAVTAAEASEKISDDMFFPSLRHNSEIACVAVFATDGTMRYAYGTQCDEGDELERLGKAAMAAGLPKNFFSGTTWGVFWPRNRHLVVSAPLRDMKGGIIGGASVLIRLDSVYDVLRRSQSLLFLYIILNTLLLSWVGFYWISKMTIRPLQRLAKRANEYREDEEILFSVRREDTELNRLSKALNGMLKRISNDKEKLKASVHSLELANIELKKAQEDIIRAEKLASVGRLSSGIAHEIGNPIGILMGYLDLLNKEGISKNDKKEFIRRSQSELDRIRTIIRQLLDFSRPSGEDKKLVSVHDIIEDVVKIAQVQPLMTKMTIEAIPAAEQDTVMGDANKLRQVLINLMINAADAVAMSSNSENGRLIIKSESLQLQGTEPDNRPTDLKLMVIDNGIGISKEHMDNVFDPFYTTKSPGKGTGLGLSVCYMIIEEMGGSIKVSSTRDGGTVVTIRLPLLQESL